MKSFGIALSENSWYDKYFLLNPQSSFKYRNYSLRVKVWDHRINDRLSACLKFISGFQPQSGDISITTGETRGN
jgi:hypothetical protein